MSTFISRSSGFFLDDEEFHLISGAIHYFRVPRAYWRDRLEKLIAQGCNVVETYLPWNLHEPRPGLFNFTDELDFQAFLCLAQELGLKAIIRPSPYICGEFEFGGLPWWLLQDPMMRVRSLHPGFIAAVNRYYSELLPRLASMQCTRGGPIIACQLENEYGYYGNDSGYLRELERMLRVGGIEVLLFTVDGPWGEAIEAGSLDDVLITGSFGNGAPEHFRRIRSLQPGQPLVCSEFWMGWFDAWGDEHHTRDPDSAAKSLDEILVEGHVNLYMFHGGTNFGFTAGSNHYEELKPDVTSYDYDAPLSEAGDPTPKFHAFRDIIARRARDGAIRERLASPYDSSQFSTRIIKRNLGSWPVTDSLPLEEALSSIGTRKVGNRPYSMEELDQGYGYVLYKIELDGPKNIERFVLWNCHDRAVVYVNGKPVARQVGNEVGLPLSLALPQKHNRVDILVENQGRVNFGEKMDSQRKGILGSIIVDKHAHCSVETWGLPLDNPDRIPWKKRRDVIVANDAAESGGEKISADTASFYRIPFRCQFNDNAFTDTFLSLEGWGKGVAWVNGHNLGRFWEIGPQKHLYVPGPYINDGANELVIFESEGICSGSVDFLDQPNIDGGVANDEDP